MSGNTLRCGLCSVTFRGLKPSEIVALTVKSGLTHIEWGGDVHVPPTDVGYAAQIRALTEGNGLCVSSYGSYFRLTGSALPQIKTAAAIGGSVIRMWAGSTGSAETSAEERLTLIDAARGAVKRAQANGVKNGGGADMLKVAFEWHGGTLTDTALSAVSFARETDASLYWQPNQYRDYATNLAELKLMLPHLANVHVFAWEGARKLPLSAHERYWRGYIDAIRTVDKSPVLLMEFVPDDSPDSLLRDAETLLKWVE